MARGPPVSAMADHGRGKSFEPDAPEGAPGALASTDRLPPKGGHDRLPHPVQFSKTACHVGTLSGRRPDSGRTTSDIQCHENEYPHRNIQRASDYTRSAGRLQRPRALWSSPQHCCNERTPKALAQYRGAKIACQPPPAEGASGTCRRPPDARSARCPGTRRPVPGARRRERSGAHPGPRRSPPE